MAGWVFLTSMVYLTLLVAFVVSLLEFGFEAPLARKTLTRWGKFLLLLGGLGVVIVGLTVAQGLFV